MTNYCEPIKLTDEIVISDFDCANEAINDWLFNRARKAQNNGTAVVYCLLTDEQELAGFYSLSAHSVFRGDINGGWLARNTPSQVPSVLLCFLGVNKKFQGHGVGKSLLHDALMHSRLVSQHIGAKAIIVDHISEDIVPFYEKHDFKHLKGTPRMAFPLV